MTPAHDDDPRGTLPGHVVPPGVEALARWISAQVRPGTPLTVGINGAQGSGKTTLAERLRHALEREHTRRMAVLSIDDFYATRAQREALSQSVHPLLLTRGVPGTHDVALIDQVLRDLRAGHSVQLPRFVKAQDDRAPDGSGEVVTGPVDVVLFEGWCVGTPPQAADELQVAVNRLESEEDADGRWRRHVNDRLATEYARLFERLDRLVFLQAPGFEVVHRWRLEQEIGNAAAAPGAAHVMDSVALERFIAHYERLTRHALRVLPSQADVVIELDDRRRPRTLRIRPFG